MSMGLSRVLQAQHRLDQLFAVQTLEISTALASLHH